MRFIVDECTGPRVARWLVDQGYDCISVYSQARGIEDKALLNWAYKDNRILVTNDKDFGELVFREKMPHRGIILLRLEDESTPKKIAVLKRLLKYHGDSLVDSFVVAKPDRVRIKYQNPRE